MNIKRNDIKIILDFKNEDLEKAINQIEQFLKDHEPSGTKLDDIHFYNRKPNEYCDYLPRPMELVENVAHFYDIDSASSERKFAEEILQNLRRK